MKLMYTRMKPEKYTISTNQILVKSSDHTKVIKVVDQNTDDNWLIRVQKPNGETTIMHKATLLKLYRPAKAGYQTSLFPKPKTRFDILKENHLITAS